MTTRLELDERRRQLMAVGAELFATRPYDEIAIGHIAAAAGISKGLLYHYFGSKRLFYVAVIREAAEAMLAATAPPGDLGPREALEWGVDAYLAHIAHHGQGYVALMRGGIGTDDEVRAILDANRDAFADRLLGGLEGEPGPVVRLAVRGYVGYVEAVSLAWLESGAELSREAVRELLVGAFSAVPAGG